MRNALFSKLDETHVRLERLESILKQGIKTNSRKINLAFLNELFNSLFYNRDDFVCNIKLN